MQKPGKGLIAKESVWCRNNSSITDFCSYLDNLRGNVTMNRLSLESPRTCATWRHIFRKSWKKKGTLCKNALLFYFDHSGFNGSTRTLLWYHLIWTVYFYLYYWSHYFWKFILLESDEKTNEMNWKWMFLDEYLLSEIDFYFKALYHVHFTLKYYIKI